MSSTRNWPVGDCNTYVEPLERRRLLSVSLDLSSTLLSPDPAALQQFGSVLATQGNLALVGVPGTSVTVGANTFDLAGSAYLIDTTTDSVVRRFDNPDPGSFDQFGAAVAFAGSGRIAIAAPGDAASGGSVYIYADATDTTPDALSGAAFTQPGLPFPGFGTSISAYGDDGLLVDVNVDPFSPQDSGLVQLYDLNTLGVIRTFANPDPNNAQVDHFGSSMAVSGDQALFSARILDTNGAPERVVFQINADTGDLVRTYHQPTPDDQQVFGQAIAFAGNDILISAPQPDFNLPDKQLGEVYHFDATSGQLLGTIQDPDQTANDAMFGSSMAISGNVAVIGAPLQTGQAWQVAYDPITFEPLLDANGNPVLQLVDMPVGSVFAIDLTTGDLIARADSPTPAATADSGMDNNFGQAVAALDNNRFLVGTPGDDHAANDQTLTDAGAVYLYTLQNSVPENQPPVADAGADQSVDQGATLVLSGIASHDPDGDTLMYSWSIDGGDFSAPSTDPTLAFNQSRPGQYDLTLLVADPSGATSTDSLLVTVNNVAPKVSAINAASAAVRQQQLAFSATASDAGGLADLDSATWSFGDGSAAQTAGVVNGQITAIHAFAAAGVYNVTLAVSDVDQAVTIVSFQVTVSATTLVDGNLLVGGSTSSSAITITPGNGGSGIMTNINGTSQNYASVPGKVIVFGGPGNDLIVVAASIDNDVELYGGGGNNVLKGGSGNDIIVGGDGSDLILGGDGRDLLIGGRGVDMIVGNQSDDILIAGPTVHDSDPAALRTIMTQWTSSASYSTRVASLQSTMLRADVDVFDDGAADILTGNAGTDWFIFNQDGPVSDYALDLHGGEMFNDVDIVSLSQQ